MTHIPRSTTRRDFLAGLATLVITSVSAPLIADARPAKWAKSVVPKIDGAPNLYKVSNNFYRSAQPTAKGMAALKAKLHIHTVISLRYWHPQLDAYLLRGTGIELVRVPMNTWHIENEDVILALKSLHAAQAKGPVLLHCEHGADRTGLITALYRIVYQGWTKQQAVDEMLHGKFGYHAFWRNIPDYIRDVDVAWLKRQVRL